MEPSSLRIAVLMLALVLGVPRFDPGASQDSYATATTNSGSVVQRQVEEKITPDEDEAEWLDSPNGDPGLDVMTTPKHPSDADRLSP